MWSLATLDMFDDFEITFYDTKELALIDIESMIGEFSENDFDENAQTLEEFIQSVKDETNPNIVGFHWRTSNNEFINLEFHDNLKKV